MPNTESLMKTHITFLLLFLVSSFSSRAQRVMSLDSVLVVIERSNPVVKFYDADVRAADEAAKGAKAWAPPQIGAGLYMTPYDLRESANRSMGAVMISAEQMFPNSSEQDAKSAYLRAVSSVSRENKRYSLNALYASAKENYFSWIMNQKKLSVLYENEKLLHFMIESAELRYKNNLGKLDAYYKAKASLGKLENQRIEISNNIVQNRILLNTLMNRPKTADLLIDTAFSTKTYERVDTGYLSLTRSDVRAINQQINLNQLEWNLEKTKLKPQFGLQYNHMMSFGNNPWLFSLMGTMKIPLAPWSSGTYKANMESLRWKAQALTAQREMLLNEATGQANGMIAGLKSKAKQVLLYEEKIIPALRRNFQAMQLSYEQNTGELFELFDAWESLNMTQLDYLEQLQDFLNIQVQLDKTLEQK